MEDLPVALSGSADSVIGWPSLPGDVASIGDAA
jgi:hypothetical protein